MKPQKGQGQGSRKDGGGGGCGRLGASPRGEPARTPSVQESEPRSRSVWWATATPCQGDRGTVPPRHCPVREGRSPSAKLGCC